MTFEEKRANGCLISKQYGLLIKVSERRGCPVFCATSNLQALPLNKLLSGKSAMKIGMPEFD